MKKVILTLTLATITIIGMTIFTRCSSDNSNSTATSDNSTSNANSESTPAKETFDTLKDLGIGPVTAPITLGSVDDALAESGSKIFAAKCVACHALDKKVVGPALGGVTKRRAPEWIMNQILNPSDMTSKDPVAKDLLGRYIAQMANQNLTQDEARQVLEYFRKNDNH